MVMMELTKEQIDEGALLIEAIDGSGLSPLAALWLHQPEYRRWKLVLAEEGVESRGPSLAGMRLLGDFVEDRMIEEAYIYRLRKPAA